MEKRRDAWIVLCREWAANRVDREIDYVYSSKSNASRAIHNRKRNLLTAICALAKAEYDRACRLRKKVDELTKTITDALQSVQIHRDSNTGHGTTRTNFEQHEGSVISTDGGDEGSNRSD